MNIDIDAYDPLQMQPDYHDVFSVRLIELIEDGVVDFSTDFWYFDTINDDTRKRIYEKITARYLYREIGILPPRRWMDETIRKLREIMPKYNVLYAALDSGVNPLQLSDEYYKARNVFSDYPQTQIGGNQDYATNANDTEHERVVMGNWLDMVDRFRTYDDVDVMIVDELESMFSCLLTLNMNAI